MNVLTRISNPNPTAILVETPRRLLSSSANITNWKVVNVNDADEETQDKDQAVNYSIEY